MSTYKVKCTNPTGRCTSILEGSPTLAPWEDHPALKLAFDCLNAYNYWVSQRVIPIAFQWIDEHHDEVYGQIPLEKHDDVGAVIASAFEIMRNNDKYNAKYKEGLDLAMQIENGDIEPSECNCNPMWAEVGSELQDHLAEALESHETQLLNMIQQMRAPAATAV
jgi:hypothetical protein